ncbi:MAG: VTT domain-containing protein [Phycisphaerae bacterium]|nr:VTT domain-containing protein [Phycisphaerae bacterium]
MSADPPTPTGVEPRLRALVATPRRLALTLLVVLAIPIIASFALLEDPLATWSDAALAAQGSPMSIAALCAGLLASDILLPIPSSVVATFAARMLDPTYAVAAIVGGSAASATLGWLLGRLLRRAALERVVGADALERADRSFGRWGLWAYACTRAVPILAEELAILAGAHRVPFWRVYLPLTLAASLPMALFYVAAVRLLSRTDGADPPFWALALVASALPLLGLVVAAIGARRRTPDADR